MKSNNNPPFFRFADYQPRVADNMRLREPQREAYLATRDHFIQEREPVLIQIPVGCGKTGLISILPFGIASGRVLAVSPNVTIRDSIHKAVDSANRACFWNSTGVARPSPVGPFAAVLDGPKASIDDCLQSHFVVANVQQISNSSNRWLSAMGSNFFDMIILDEAHHNAANSWRRLMDFFPSAKIISLTATPFRSDGQEVIGKPIYRYSFKRAMGRGYIKSLKAVQVYPCEISFTFRDSNETATLEEVLELREEAWFSRGVALADQCNEHIAKASLEACLRLRQATGHKHQIIAAACSVEHAERLTMLYRQLGFQAMDIHSKQAKTTQRFVLKQLRDGKIDTIIQVQMLGEGFDHPSLSVAAVFRPFRSLSPYVQFVGRVMRVIRQNCPNHPDNRGVVISHVGMNTERHWDQFKELDTEDQDLWSKLIHGDSGMDSEPIDEPFDKEELDNESTVGPATMMVDWERLGDHAVSHYATVDFQPEVTDEQPKTEEPTSATVVVGPQERRRQAQSRLKSEVERSVRMALNQIRVHGLGQQVSKMHPMLRFQNNWNATRYWLYYNLNRTIGRKPKSGKDWSLEEIENALDSLPNLLDQFVVDFQQRHQRRF